MCAVDSPVQLSFDGCSFYMQRIYDARMSARLLACFSVAANNTGLHTIQPSVDASGPVSAPLSSTAAAPTTAAPHQGRPPRAAAVAKHFRRRDFLVCAVRLAPSFGPSEGASRAGFPADLHHAASVCCVHHTAVPLQHVALHYAARLFSRGGRDGNRGCASSLQTQGASSFHPPHTFDLSGLHFFCAVAAALSAPSLVVALCLPCTITAIVILNFKHARNCNNCTTFLRPDAIDHSPRTKPS